MKFCAVGLLPTIKIKQTEKLGQKKELQQISKKL